MMPIFTACQKFAPCCGESWLRYIEWSKFHHLRELVSTDSILCPSLIDTLMDEDWEYNIHEDNRTHLFRDYHYLKRRIDYDAAKHNLLAIAECATKAFEPIQGFSFCGYDILDSDDSISVLTNCGGFPSIFATDDLNPLGLISELDRVSKIAATIRDTHADDHHCADCRVWGIARYDNT
jgi:hypothetical protein